MATHHLSVANRGVCPEFAHETTDELRAVGDPDARVVLRGRLGSVRRRRFRLEWHNASEGVRWELEQLFVACGSWRSMNYVPPDETEIVEVRFLERSLVVTRESVNHYSVRFEVEEVIR